MKITTLDGNKIRDAKALHERLSEDLGFQEYYGKNFDALYDVLTALGEETRIEIKNEAGLKEALGDKYGAFVRLLKDAAEENDKLSFEFCGGGSEAASGEGRKSGPRLLIASDIHGSAYYCGKLMEAFASEGADKLLLLGDILYHGPRNDLPEGYEPKSAIELLNEQKERILCVRGNCDSEVDQMVLEFPIMAEYALIDLGKHTIFATHGHIYDKFKLPPLGCGDILLHGHTHVPAWEDLGAMLYLNPGSVSIPKGGSAHGYMTYSDGVFRWKELIGGGLIHELELK